MAHLTNRTAFRSGTTTEPFLRLYTLLMGIEIALKDHRPWSSGHDLRILATRALAPLPLGVATQLTALDKCISALTCTARDGTAAPVDPTVYPGIRYLRHDADFPGGSQALKISAAINAARQLADEIERAGVSL